MKPNLAKRSIPVAIVAFLQRALARSLGSYRRPVCGVDIQKRAGRYLLDLNRDEKSLTFKIALENLRSESDLLDEESALVPEGLELQRKVVELADRYEIAAELVKEGLTQAPVARLMTAIFTEAQKAGSQHVQIDFNLNRGSFPVLYELAGNWTEMMRIPGNLEEPLRGAIARVEGIGFSVLAPHLELKQPLPADVRFTWIDSHRLDITMDPPTTDAI
jgi:hypothetical protein